VSAFGEYSEALVPELGLANRNSRPPLVQDHSEGLPGVLAAAPRVDVGPVDVLHLKVYRVLGFSDRPFVKDHYRYREIARRRGLRRVFVPFCYRKRPPRCESSKWIFGLWRLLRPWLASLSCSSTSFALSASI
jgi:hypothetical protein